MLKSIVGLGAGIVFGIGLVLSGMSNPAKVLNFLDLFGTFDASLICVMGGAVLTVFIGYKLILKRSHPLLAEQFHIPTRQDIDGNLVIGAVLFGIGWGIGGFCPGPALTSILLGSEGIVYFFPTMIIGLMCAKLWSNKKSN
jgi:uncharacterized protein